MRELVRAERVDGSPPAPPDLAGLDALVHTARACGTQVSLTTAGDLDAVPAGVAAACFRVVQEPLTNAQRHAGPGADVSVHVRVHGGSVHAVVSSRPGAATSGPAAAGNGSRGTGLLAMRERVELVGGHLTHGTTTGGAFLVEARIPTMRPGSRP